jgi:hypothetical protein
MISQGEFIKPKEGYNHAYKIVKSFGVIEIILDWCKRELPNEWRWQLVEVSTHSKNGEYIFYFDSEKDYLSFIMKWA